MGLLNWLKNHPAPPVKIGIYAPPTQEKLKGLVIEDQEFTFKVERDRVGIEHPFNFKTCEDVFKKVGFVTGVVNKYVDFVVGAGFTVEAEDKGDKRAVDVIKNYIASTDFDQVLRAWLAEALIKGNSFIEMGGKPDAPPESLRVLNANNCFVKRDEYGKIIGYTQVRDTKQAALKDQDIITFQPHEIAHLMHNRIADSTYGCGIVYPALDTINSLLGAEKEMQTLLKRKAGSPTIVYVGNRDKDQIPEGSVIDAIGQKLEHLTNKTEWCFDDNVRVTTLDYGKLADKFEPLIEHNLDMLFFTFQVPEVLMGRGNIAEGLATAQLEAFERRVISIQQELENVITNKIFKRVLNASAIDQRVKFKWKQLSPGETRESLRLKKEYLDSFSVGPAFKNELLKRAAAEFGINPELVESDEVVRQKFLDQPQPVVPGQNRPDPNMEAAKQLREAVKHEDDLTIAEWTNFNYQDYLRHILQQIRQDQFIALKATTQAELEAGYLTEPQIAQLRSVLSYAFARNLSLREITKRIEQFVQPGQLLRMEDGKIKTDAQGKTLVQMNASYRAGVIARSETVRLSNAGAIEQYKEAGFKRYVWVASLDNLTCPICLELNGKTFDINTPIAEYAGANSTRPQAHTGCRCTTFPVTE